MREQRRLDRRPASIECALYNIHRDRKKHPAAYKVHDFMPTYGEKGAKPGKMDSNKLKAKMMGMHSRYSAVKAVKKHGT